MKEIVHFSTPDFLHQGDIITSPFTSPEAHIISDRSVIQETLSQLRENVGETQHRDQLYRKFTEEKGTAAISDFFLYQNFEFTGNTYSHVSLYKTEPSVLSIVKDFISGLRLRLESFADGLRASSHAFAAS